MKIIVTGCGRLGSGLAQAMTRRGHAVIVVDEDPAAFKRLGPWFKGQTVAGSPIDREALPAAGIERTDGLAAVTASDEANVVAARVALRVFRVPRVGARLASLLLSGGHAVKVVEARPEEAGRLARKLPRDAVPAGNGTDPAVLEAAGIRGASAAAAVPGADETNLVVPSLTHFEFGVPRSIARVKNPRNARISTPEMGVDVALNQADLLAHLVAIRRKGQFLLPRGDVVLHPADEVLALVHASRAARLAAVLGRGQVFRFRNTATYHRQPRYVDGHQDMLPGIVRSGMPPPGTRGRGTRSALHPAPGQRFATGFAPGFTKMSAEGFRDVDTTAYRTDARKALQADGERGPDRMQSLPGVRAPRQRRREEEERPVTAAEAAEAGRAARIGDPGASGSSERRPR